MQLIGMLDSPYVRRIAVTLLTAGVKFEHRPISLFRHIDAFRALSPLLKAPSLIVDDGTVLVESSVILDYLGTLSRELKALTPSASANPLKSARLTGVALTVCEKAVQIHYERVLRTPDQQNPDWRARIDAQLTEGLEALNRETPDGGWVAGGSVGAADIMIACAFGFTQVALADLVAPARYPRLTALYERAEALPAFRAAPPIDGVTAPIG